MNSSRSHSMFMAELGESRLCASQPTLTSYIALTSFHRGKLVNEKQPLDWSQMPRTDWGWGSQVGKAMFVQPSLGPPSPSSIQEVLTLGRSPRRKGSITCGWGRAGPEEPHPRSPPRESHCPLHSLTLPFNHLPNKSLLSAYDVLALR